MSKTTMSLAEAMRLGSMTYKSHTRTMFAFEPGGARTTVGACALGTAALAAGFEPWQDSDVHKFLYTRFPELMWRGPCPCHPSSTCGVMFQPGRHESLATVVAHLNDQHGWTREQIAAWIDTLGLTPADASAQPVHVGEHDA